MKFTPEPLVLKPMKMELEQFYLYLQQCAVLAFLKKDLTGYLVYSKLTEEFLQFHTKELLDLVHSLIRKLEHEQGNKVTTMKISHAQRISLSTLFKRVETSSFPIIQELEYKIINRLALTA
jgi:hypothetical protein